MITRQQALEMFERDDLIGLGMGADAVRRELHPGGLVSYCMEPGSIAVTLDFGAQESIERILSRFDDVRGCVAVKPRSQGTAAEYLKMLALTRICLDDVPHLQVGWEAGLKLGQIALRFGANDVHVHTMLGAEAGGVRATEEEIRRLIRDAGFVPKERDVGFGSYYLS